ncbi:MAG: ATP-binding protein [Gemmataceae bacterium]
MSRPLSTLHLVLISVLLVSLFCAIGRYLLHLLVQQGRLEAEIARWLAISWLGLLGLLTGSFWLINHFLVSGRLMALAERETQRGRKIVEAAADAIITFDSLGRIESFNAAASRLFGYSPQEVLGQPISKLIVAEESSNQVEALVQEEVPTGSGRVLPDNTLFKGRHKDGHLIAIELGVSKMIDEDRKVFVQIIRDLSERQQAEKQRQLQYEVALHLNNARDLREASPAVLQAIGRALAWPVGLLWELDTAQNVLRCQAGWTNLERGRPLIESLSKAQLYIGEGLPGRVWLHHNYRWIDRLESEPSLPGQQLAINAGLHAAIALPMELGQQFLGVVEFYAPQIPPPNPALLNNLYPVLMQISQFIRRRWDEAALRRAKEAAEAASKAKSEFISSISHEVRTPLHGIIGLTEILLAGPLSEKQREYLQLVQTSSEMLLRLINDMLDFGKLEAARMTLEAVPFELRKTLEPNLKTFAVQAEQKGLVFRAEISEEIPAWLIGDPLRLQQVIVNLVGNALKFTAQGEIVLTLNVASRTEQAIVLRGAVRDTGIGIPSDQLDAIFDAFRQVDSSRTRKYGGTGLGLTIASRLVNLMKGRIWVESTPGQGSTFHFTVGLHVCDPPAPQKETIPTLGEFPNWTSPPPNPLLTGKRILVAEDNPVNRMVLQLILESRQHQVVWAKNGLEAVQRFHDSPVDLILMDLQLPEMDGIEATRLILKASERLQRPTCVIGLTAHAEDEDRRRCLEAGMTHFLIKPIQPAELLQIIDEVLTTLVGRGNQLHGSLAN